MSAHESLYVEDRRGERVWVTERACQDRNNGTRWIETELNVRRQAVALGEEEGWHYVVTFGEFPPPPMDTAYLRGPYTSIEWVCFDIIRSSEHARWSQRR